MVLTPLEGATESLTHLDCCFAGVSSAVVVSDSDHEARTECEENIGFDTDTVLNARRFEVAVLASTNCPLYL